MNGKHYKRIPGHNSKKELFLKESYERTQRDFRKENIPQASLVTIQRKSYFLKRVMKVKQQKSKLSGWFPYEVLFKKWSILKLEPDEAFESISLLDSL